MTNIDHLADQVSTVEQYLTILERFRTVTEAQLEADVVLRGAVERYLYLVTQAAIDLGESVIAYRGWRKPTEYKEVFTILGEHDVLEADLVRRLTAMTGFRNVLAHEYVALNLDVAVRALVHDRADIEAYLTAIRRSLTDKHES